MIHQGHFTDKKYIMGILNATPDSFATSGVDISNARSIAEQMISDGADIIDIGGESTRPGATSVSLEEEIARVVPVVRALQDLPCILSIDTYKSEVAARCLDLGVSIVNDISAGLLDEKMASVVKSYDAWWVLMHNSRLMTERQPNIAYTVCAALNKRRDYAYSQGCKKLIVDPGIGFGKKGLENVALTKQLDKLQWFEVPILYGCSRKKFIGGITGVEDANQRVVGTEYCNAIALAMGANILRVHDVKSARRSIKMHEAFYGA